MNVFVLFSILSCLIFNSCTFSSDPELFLIPDKYEGAVVIFFEQKDGQEARYVDGRRLYSFSNTGFLSTKFPKTKHGRLNQEYYYKDNLGNRKLKLKTNLLEKGNDSDRYIMNIEYGTFKNSNFVYPLEYMSFTVGKLKNIDSLRKVSELYLESLTTSH